MPFIFLISLLLFVLFIYSLIQRCPAKSEAATGSESVDANAPTVTSLGYDPADQLLSAVVTTNTASGALLAQYLYGYDAAGNRLSEVIQSGTNNPARVNASGYNNLNQTTNVSSTGGQVLFAGTLDKAGTVTVAGTAATMYRQTNFTGYATVSQGTNVVPVTAADSYGNARTNSYQIVVTNNGVAETLSYDLDGNLTNVTNWQIPEVTPQAWSKRQLPVQQLAS